MRTLSGQYNDLESGQCISDFGRLKIIRVQDFKMI